jgi:hypothetical protein
LSAWTPYKSPEEWAAVVDSMDKAEAWSTFTKNLEENFLKTDDPAENAQRRTQLEQNFNWWAQRIAGYSQDQLEKRYFPAIIKAYDRVYTTTSGNSNLPKSTIDSAIIFGLDIQLPEDIHRYIRIMNRAANTSGITGEEYSVFEDAVRGFGKTKKGISDDFERGFVENILPRISSGDSEVAILGYDTPNWRGYSEFSLAEFVCQSFTTRVTPENLNELMMTATEIPGTTAERFWHNRKDGLLIENVFSIVRWGVHEEKPWAHDLVAAMVKYYDEFKEKDQADKVELERIFKDITKNDPPKNENVQAYRHEQFISFLDIANYDKLASSERLRDAPIPAIDVLRRLEESTRIVDEEPPVTADTDLNEKMKLFKGSSEVNENTMQLANDVFKHANQILVEAMQEMQLGVESSKVLACIWLNNKGFNYLKKMSYEDQLSAYLQSWFKEMVRFAELTGSVDEFNQSEFDLFWQDVQDTKGSIANLADHEAYKKIMNRIMQKLDRLGTKYTKINKPQWGNLLWTGNIANQLLELVDYKPAGTEYGRKHRAEQMRPAHERLAGD